MKLDEWELGYNPIREFDLGASVADIEPPAGQVASFVQAGAKRSFTLRIWLSAPAMGGAAAGSQAANEYLARMVEEWLNNPLLNDPILVALSSLRALPQDGWFLAEHAHVDYTFTGAGRIPVDLTLIYKGPGPPIPRRLSVHVAGGTIPSTYSTTAPTPLLGFPIGATALDPTTFSRVGAEGTIPIIFSPSSLVTPFVPSSTLLNLFKGACRVFDTLNTSSNPIPSPPTGYHANWVEVKGIDHAFVGDAIVTNGLLLMLFQKGAAPLCTIYLWSTGLATAGWQQAATLVDTAGSGFLRSYSLRRVGRSEVALVAEEDQAKVTIRLPRASYACRVDYRSRAGGNTLALTFPSTPKILYNSAAVADQTLSEQPAIETARGFGGVLIPSTSYPFLAAWLYSNVITGKQPGGAGTATIGVGDTSLTGTDTEQSYGIAFFPYGVNGVNSPANLQAEAESGTLGTGWTSQAGAGNNSNALEAKCASGTVATNADTWGTAHVPRPGRYLLAFRVKVTSAAGSTPEMTLGLWNSDDLVFMTSTTFAANQAATSYGWLYVGGVNFVTPTATKNVRFRAVTAATLGTDWFVDEAVLLPIDRLGSTVTGQGDGPADLWNQFLSDIETRLAVS